MHLAIRSGFALALVVPWLHRVAGRLAGSLTAILPLGLALYFASFSGRVAAGEVVAVSYPLAPALAINLSFCLDGLSLLFALLIAGIGALILIFAGGYRARRWHLLLTV
jgi:multicomponent Na+:H+ antiporter subunit A